MISIQSFILIYIPLTSWMPSPMRSEHNRHIFYVDHQGQFNAYVHSELKNSSKNTRRSNTQLFWPICPTRRHNSTTTPIRCCRRGSSLSTRITPFPDTTIGCSKNQTMSSPTSATPRAEGINSQKRQKHHKESLLICAGLLIRKNRKIFLFVF